MSKIEIINGYKEYIKKKEKISVLENINVKFEKEKLYAIMGESGSGKTTLLNIIGTLDTLTKGKLLINDKEIINLKDEEKAKIRMKEIGFVFQNFNLIGRSNAQKNVELPLLYAGVPARERSRRAKELLELVGMGQRSRHKPAELSGGQKQRVAIARALACEAPLLLADEPTGALDTATSRTVMDLFHRLHKEQGKTIVLITHSPQLAAETERVITLMDGCIVGEEKGGAYHDG